MSNDVLFSGLDAVLFDLDGTLIDSTDVTSRAWATWGRELGLDREDFHEHGVPARQVVAALVATGEIPSERADAAVERIKELEENDAEGVVMLPGAAELLASISAARWSIVTSCTARLAAVRMGAVRLSPPAHLVTADAVSRGKPDPEGYLLGATRLGSAPAATLVVEDTPAGLAAGRAAGMLTLGVAGTYPADQLDADVVLDSLGGVRAVVADDGTLRLLRG